MDKGDYWVRERTAPRGFKVNGSVTKVSVPAGSHVEFTVKDEPVSDPIALSVRKVDADGATVGSADRNGSLTTVGTEFTVRYYDRELDSASWANASTALPDGTYYVETALTDTEDSASTVSGKAPACSAASVLDVAWASTADGANVQTWPLYQTAGQEEEAGIGRAGAQELSIHTQYVKVLTWKIN